jgi:hypothetical protein
MDIVGSFFSLLLDLIDLIDPFPHLHRLMNSRHPILGAAVVGIPIVAVLFAPVGYWLHWESNRDKKRLRRQKARTAKYKARAAAGSQGTPRVG